MSNRVTQFIDIQYLIENNNDEYEKELMNFINNYKNSGSETSCFDRLTIKTTTFNEIKNEWIKISKLVYKTNTEVRIYNLVELHRNLSILQFYTSIGYIVYEKPNTDDILLDITSVNKSISEFREIGLKLFTRKNADYGDAFANFGIIGIIIRMGDKIARITSLLDKPAQVTDESISDTFIDLYNYSIMAMMLIGEECLV